jgi:hypothetical protein
MDRENEYADVNHIYITHIIYICVWNTVQPQKECNPVICGKMDLTGGPYVKRNKPCSQRKTLHDLTHMWDLKMLISWK